MGRQEFWGGHLIGGGHLNGGRKRKKKKDPNRTLHAGRTKNYAERGPKGRKGKDVGKLGTGKKEKGLKIKTLREKKKGWGKTGVKRMSAWPGGLQANQRHTKKNRASKKAVFEKMTRRTSKKKNRGGRGGGRGAAKLVKRRR